MGNLKICGQLQKCLGTSIVFLGILNNYAGHIYNFRTLKKKNMGSENISGATKYFSVSIHMFTDYFPTWTAISFGPVSSAAAFPKPLKIWIAPKYNC